MTIQDVAEQTGISAYTIRFYEKSGVLPRIKRRPNGIRQFTEADVTFLRFLIQLKQTGMSLEDIMEFTEDPDIPIAPGTLLAGNKGILGYSISNLSRVDPKHLAETAQRAIDLLVTGQIRLAITDTLPLEQASMAHRRIEGNASTGKLLLQVRS
jgi:DNA-binding transcriptional MerR regulator